jgi:hypothetical protein
MCVAGGNELVHDGWQRYHIWLAAGGMRGCRSNKGALKECPLPCGVDLEMDVYLDGSILEMFINQRVTLTARLYPTRMDDLHFYGYASPPGLHMENFKIREIRSCY